MTRPLYRPVRDAPTVPTARQLEVVGHLSRGLSRSQVGAAMHITEATVRAHLWEVAQRLGVRTAAGLVGECYRRGLL